MPSIYQSIDPVGYVKKLDDFYVRKINHQYNNHTLQIIKSGALDALVDLNLFPKTDVHKKHENIFLYHTKIKYFSIPAEWSFDMLKDAILTMLDVDTILQRFGYTLKDFHFDNICFSNGNIFFIDFGSIIEVTNTSPPCTYFDEFLQYIYYPLFLWSKGNGYLAHRYLSDEIHNNRFFGIHTNPCLPLHIKLYKFITKIKLAINKKMRKNFFHIKNEPTIYKKFIKKLVAPETPSPWGGYHCNFMEHFEFPEERFTTLINEIVKLRPKTMLDLAGNAGYFSLLCSKRLQDLEHIYCCDCDHNAVNSLYNFIKRDSEFRNITPILMNIIFPDIMLNSDHYSRLKSDIVCVLAVTHHLFLTQHINCDYFFSEVKKYTGKVAIIEFMPLGLYDGHQSKPIPTWYTKTWFERHFSKYFTKIKELQLDKNRIAFFGLPT